MTAIITVGNLYSSIKSDPPLEDIVIARLSLALSYKMKDSRFMIRAMYGEPKKDAPPEWDGTVKMFWHERGNLFYTGMMSSVTEILTSFGVDYDFEFIRKRPEINMPDLKLVRTSGMEDREYQEVSIEMLYEATRGIMQAATGSGKCLGKGTQVLMFSGKSKAVEDVVAGDLLMGPDSTPRTVKSLARGYGDLFLIKQNNGEDFICNDEHILCLQTTSSPSRRLKGGKEVEIKSSDYYSSSKTFKHLHKGYKVGVDFCKKKLPVDPYFLGLWLGDSHSHLPAITTGDYEIVNYLRKYALDHNLKITEAPGNGCKIYFLVNSHRSKLRSPCKAEGCKNISITGGLCNKHYHKEHYHGFRAGKHLNPLTEALRNLDVINNKHIPDSYKINDRISRLKLLAGLIDSDGSFVRSGCLEFSSSNKRLADDVCWLSRSLGYRASINIKKTSIKSLGYKGISYRLMISGNISDIPVLLKRKQAGDKTKYSALRYGISATPIGQGEYFGFEIDGDRKFLLGDFTVTHNTFMAADLISRIKTSPFIFYVLSVDLLEQAHGELSKFLNVPIGKVGGGKVDIKEINVVMVQSAIRALHRNDAKFDMSSYKYDDEDQWLEDSAEEMEKAGQIVEMIKNAKGLVFDECHHVASRTARETIEASKLAYFRYGLSATPTRDDGQEPMIKALFGKKIVEISASLLIQLGYLVKPHIFVVKMNDFHGDHASYSSIYKHYVADNQVLNDLVIKMEKFFDERKVSNLTLVKQYSQGEYIKKGHGDINFIRGDQSKKKRVDALDKLRSGEITGCVATTLADEGLDVRRLSAVIVAGGGKSQTRVYQRIGRALRTFTDEITGEVKDTAIVILFHHNCRFLDGHGRTIKRLLSKEKEFVIKDTTPEKIFDDLSELLSPQENLLDLFKNKV